MVNNCCDRIFEKRTEKDVLDKLIDNRILYHSYQSLDASSRKKFMEFMCGKGTLPLTYDPFFKMLFNPDIYPERLSDFISSILGIAVKVKQVLPTEECMLHGNSLLIMDIIVELSDGSIANVEIQRIPYLFPGERMSCYSADLLLRQYSRVKGQMGKDFSYKHLKKVYTIIIYEESPGCVKNTEKGNIFVHRGSPVFDSGIQIGMLQEYCIISLDVFKEYYYSENIRELNNLNAWLALLSSDSISELDTLISDYPWMEAVVRSMAEYLYKPEEVLYMFSEALKIMDDNTVKYMIDELNSEIKEKVNKIEEKNNELSEKENELAEKNNELTEKENELSEKENELAEKNNELAEKENELTEKENELAEKNNELAEKENELTEKNNELAEKNNELAEKNNELAEKDNELTEKDKELTEKDKELAEKNNELAEKDNELTEKENELAEKENELAEKENELTEKDKELTEKDNTIAEKDAEIAKRDAEIANLSERIARLEALLMN